MKLEDVAKVIYVAGTESENRKIEVVNYNTGEVLWMGKAYDLKYWKRLWGWDVVEILVDHSEDETNGRKIPDHNKGKIITVI